MNETEILVRAALKYYGAEEATEDIMDIFRSMNRKKLTDTDVRTIRMLHKKGVTQAEIAEDFGINSATVSRIVRGIYH